MYPMWAQSEQIEGTENVVYWRRCLVTLGADSVAPCEGPRIAPSPRSLASGYSARQLGSQAMEMHYGPGPLL
jgi:hypothetical protein